jgi:hypothetical protein
MVHNNPIMALKVHFNYQRTGFAVQLLKVCLEALPHVRPLLSDLTLCVGVLHQR